MNRWTPMEPIAHPAPFDHPDWLFQVKWDGIRALVYVEKGGVRIFNRKGRDISDRYPEIASAPLLQDGLTGVVDGELVVLDEGGKPSFPLVLRRDRASTALAIREGMRKRPALFMAFDLLELNGRPLVDQPLEQRLARLAEGLQPGERIWPSDSQRGEGVAFFEAMDRLGLEGMVAKEIHSPYTPGKKHDHWKKVKCFRELECWVIGYTQTLPDAVASLALGVQEDGETRYAGRVGSGLDRKEAAEWYQRLAPIRSKRMGEEYIPVSPFYRVRVRYLEWTPDLRLRNPSYLGMATTWS